jgi:hypothetical protein
LVDDQSFGVDSIAQHIKDARENVEKGKKVCLFLLSLFVVVSHYLTQQELEKAEEHSDKGNTTLLALALAAVTTVAASVVAIVVVV